MIGTPEPGPPREPTYEELRRQAQARWEAVARERAARFEELRSQLAQMDETKAPDPQEPWSAPGVVHPCGGAYFQILRWVTVNGRRHRWFGVCLECNAATVWDWNLSRWLEP